MGTADQKTFFCPDDIFLKLDTYITQLQILENIQLSNTRRISTRTMGSISILENIGQKQIEINDSGVVLYLAKKTEDWKIIENILENWQIEAIKNLPQTKEEIFIDFYSRTLTHKLKELFQAKSYPIEQQIILNHAQLPYSFHISPESTTKRLIFVGTNFENEIVFLSSYYKDTRIQISQSDFLLEHVNQLSCFN